MKKKILSIATAILTAVTISVSAQTPANCNPCYGKRCIKTTCEQPCKTGKPCKQECVQKTCPLNKAFELMNLTENQKAQLQTLCEKRKTERSAKRQEYRQNDKKAREERRNEARASKKQYLEDVKAIIGPENYVIFLENMVLDQPQRKNFKKAHKQGCPFIKGGKKVCPNNCVPACEQQGPSFKAKGSKDTK